VLADFRRNHWRKSYLRLTVVGVLLAITFYLLYSINAEPELWYSIGGLLFFVAVFVVVAWLRVHKALEKIFEDTPILLQEFQIQLSDAGCTLRNPLSENVRKWEAFTAYRETAGLFLMSIGGDQFVWLPKRAFNEAQLAEVRALLAAKIPPKSN
jgi:hypothetical protein